MSVGGRACDEEPKAKDRLTKETEMLMKGHLATLILLKKEATDSRAGEDMERKNYLVKLMKICVILL